jgi:peptide-methionine (S)-S-oxide reductase
MSGQRQEIATLAGGCFWCIEAVFELVRGVDKAVSGYAGGNTVSPSYYDVCTGMTGHAEVVQLTFDPDVVTYREMIDLFFVTHDPTTLNRQGPDSGTQYRSAVYYHDDAQREQAEAALSAAQSLWPNPIVTEITAMPEFYPAEDYHQEYFRMNPGQGYCQVIIAPKVAKFRKEHLEAIRA